MGLIVKEKKVIVTVNKKNCDDGETRRGVKVVLRDGRNGDRDERGSDGCKTHC